MQRIAIIGAGKIGQALAGRFIKAGYEIHFGVRDPDKGYADLKASLGESANMNDIAGAIEVCPLVVLAIPGAAVAEFKIDPALLACKTLIDCSNPIAWQEGPVWSPPARGSLAALLQDRYPEAYVVKAWNAFGVEIHIDPDINGTPATMLYAGDDQQALDAVHSLAEEAGFAPVHAGPLRNAAVLENMAVCWIHLAMVGGQGRQFVFQLSKR